MEVLLEDIARTLDATYVSLPGNPYESLACPTPGTSHFEPQNPRYRAPLPLPGQIPVDIGRLRLDDPGMGPVHPSRAREVSTPYRGMPPILTPPRSLERQLA
jgi:hypothetical protein